MKCRAETSCTTKTGGRRERRNRTNDAMADRTGETPSETRRRCHSTYDKYSTRREPETRPAVLIMRDGAGHVMPGQRRKMLTTTYRHAMQHIEHKNVPRKIGRRLVLSNGPDSRVFLECGTPAGWPGCLHAVGSLAARAAKREGAKTP